MNPNQAEASIENVIKWWADLKRLMDGVAGAPGLVPELIANSRPPTHEQYQNAQVLMRDIGYDLSCLLRGDKKSVPYDYVPPSPAFQQGIDQLLVEYIADNKLDLELLKGHTERVIFRYRETEQNYRSDERDCQIPVALAEQVKLSGHNLLDDLATMMYENASDYFDQAETDESELMSSDIEWDYGE